MNATAQKKYFTVEEANQMLPLVRAIVEDIVVLFRDVHDRRERLSRVRQLPGASSRDEKSVYNEELLQIEEDLDKDITKLEGYVDELQKLGVELKDFVSGLVDFPSKMDGREVYLCWRLGEDEVGHWHELDAGFQGRQSLLEGSVPGDGTSDDKSK
jgi:hypothetical protein